MIGKRRIAFLSFFILITACHNKNDLNLKTNKLDENLAYLIFRGTNTKEGFFAKDFNVSDTINSHVGLLIYENEWFAYNVSNSSDNQSDLKKEKLSEFQRTKDGEVIDMSIWEIPKMDESKTLTIKKNIDTLSQKQIVFDNFFSMKKDDKLYCSEFVVQVLSKTDPDNYKFNPVSKELKGIYKTYFRKDSLIYYPVDIFQMNPGFKKISEWSKTSSK
jgi:hypothetical protein